MEINTVMDRVTSWVNEMLVNMGVGFETAHVFDKYVVLVFLVLVALAIDAICRPLVVAVTTRIVKKTKATWDDIVFDPKVVGSFTRLIAPILIYMALPLIFREQPETLDFLQRISKIYIIAVIIRFISLFINAVYLVYSDKENYRPHPLKGFKQTAQVIVFSFGVIVIISTLMGQSPAKVLAGLGASAAVLMLVFKDTIMGFVSGILLSANDMLRPGDWITMPKYNADGMVIEVSLNTVKVQNWDKTITTIPPYLLVSDSFQNWRGMFESGGRRVKRSVNIDMNSVKFCTPEMLEKYRKIHLLSQYIDHTEGIVEEFNQEHQIDNSILVNGRRQTNLGVFRAYLTNYLNTHPMVNKNMISMVRQLQPTGEGIPMELYFFTAVTAWVSYEGIQADVFDHILAILPEFELRVFQNPSGADFRELASYIRN